MEDVWREFLGTTFFQPCRHHPESKTRFYCCRTRSAFCEHCDFDAASPSVVKVYRHTYTDVVRVPFKKYVNIQTFVSNGRDVVFLRPHKPIDTAGIHVYHCTCGRGVTQHGMMCSASCYFKYSRGAPSPQKKIRKPVKKVHLYQRRKPALPLPSPVY